MTQFIKKNLLLCFIGLLMQPLSSRTPAFPTAEGFGKWASGGRGGKVVAVTTVEDDGVGNLIGSLRWAVRQHPGEPLTIVFRVSGIIDLKGVNFRSKRDNITFAGQTAPGDGICIKGGSFNVGGSKNLIIRHMRFRTGDYTPSGTIVNAASFILENGSNFIIDHCSMSWSSEELCNISDNFNSTVQWCIFSEGLWQSVNSKGARGYGPVIAGDKLSFHHNLIAHTVSRSPRFGVTSDVTRHVLIDYVNNVNFNYGKSNACYGGENRRGRWGTLRVNFVNNYYKPGPAYPGNLPSRFVRASYWLAAQDTFYTRWHMSGNFIEGSANVALNANNYAGLDFSDYTAHLPNTSLHHLMSTLHPIEEPILMETAHEAFTSVTTLAGAYPNDTIDRRIKREVITGTVTHHGTYNNRSLTGIIDKPQDAGGYPEYNTFNTITDNDNDGMDDSWEISNGFDPANAEDRNRVTLSGYTVLEVYLNSLVGEFIELKFNTDTDSYTFQPKYTYQINDHILTVHGHTTIQNFQVVDLKGNVRIQSNSPSVSVERLPQGIYFLTIRSLNSSTVLGMFR